VPFVRRHRSVLELCRRVRASTSKGPSSWNRAAATARARRHSRSQLYPFRCDQGTAPQLSTYEHRLGVAISAASAIISVGATRGPVHGHPRWTLISPVVSRCRKITTAAKKGKNSRPISISRTSTIGSLASLCPSQPQHGTDEVNDRREEGGDQRLSDVTSPLGHQSSVRHADPQDD
jgi:hypothetical protein